jgi:hypothetical protein
MPSPARFLKARECRADADCLCSCVRWRNGCPDVLRRVLAPGGLSGGSSSTATNSASREHRDGRPAPRGTRLLHHSGPVHMRAVLVGPQRRCSGRTPRSRRGFPPEVAYDKRDQPARPRPSTLDDSQSLIMLVERPTAAYSRWRSAALRLDLKLGTGAATPRVTVLGQRVVLFPCSALEQAWPRLPLGAATPPIC